MITYQQRRLTMTKSNHFQVGLRAASLLFVCCLSVLMSTTVNNAQDKTPGAIAPPFLVKNPEPRTELKPIGEKNRRGFAGKLHALVSTRRHRTRFLLFPYAIVGADLPVEQPLFAFRLSGSKVGA